MTTSDKNLFKIGVVDSGSGGLSILKELQQKIPQASYEYLCDNLFFPYGELESSVLHERVVGLCQKFCQAQNIDLLVLACNTASTLVLKNLRDQLEIPVVGVVPAIKTASKLSQSKRIAIIATKRTIESPYLEDLIKDFAPTCSVFKKSSSLLVKLSEEKIAGKKISTAIIKEELRDLFLHKSLDTVVLGCTHFSHLIPELESLDPRKISWIDSKEAVAKRVQTLLQEDKNFTLNQTPQTRPSLKVFYTEEKSFQEKKINWSHLYETSHLNLFP